ncbi:MAG: autotransporter outer membrane beta-barrel domain-containing protein [Puniceicoccales bacterium]|nr:autotransporter outer membrane beta-barrel domain-containing protein [Puniceicoccales bacterium]
MAKLHKSLLLVALHVVAAVSKPLVGGDLVITSQSGSLETDNPFVFLANGGGGSVLIDDGGSISIASSGHGAALTFCGCAPIEFTVSPAAGAFEVLNVNGSEDGNCAITSAGNGSTNLNLAFGKILAAGQNSVAICGGESCSIGLTICDPNVDDENHGREISANSFSLRNLSSFTNDSTSGWTFVGQIDLSNCPGDVVFSESSLIVFPVDGSTCQSERILFGEKSPTFHKNSAIRLLLADEFEENSIKVLGAANYINQLPELQVAGGAAQPSQWSWSPLEGSVYYATKVDTQDSNSKNSEPFICDINHSNFDGSAARIIVEPGDYYSEYTDGCNNTILNMNGHCASSDNGYDGAPAVAIDTSNMFLDEAYNGRKESASGQHISWDGRAAIIDLGEGGRIVSKCGRAVGNWQLPLEFDSDCHYRRKHVKEKFLSPNVEIVGSGEISGAKAFSIVASDDNISASDADELHTAGIGGLTIGNGESLMRISGDIELKMFAGQLGDALLILNDSTIGDFSVVKNAVINGNIVLDNSVKNADIVAMSSHSIGKIDVCGEIFGRLCASVAPWCCGSLGEDGLGVSFSIGDVRVSGNITTESGSAFILDVAEHGENAAAKNPNCDFVPPSVTVEGTETSIAAIRALDGAAMVIRGGGELSVKNAALDGRYAVVLDPVIHGRNGKLVLGEAISIGSESCEIAIAGYNLAVGVGENASVLLSAPTGYAMARRRGEYSYDCGATIFDGVAPAQGVSGVSLRINGRANSLRCDGAVSLDTLAFIAVDEPVAAIDFRGALSVGNAAVLRGPCRSFHASSVDLFRDFSNSSGSGSENGDHSQSVARVLLSLWGDDDISIGVVDASGAEVAESGCTTAEIVLGDLDGDDELWNILDESDLATLNPRISAAAPFLRYGNVGTIIGNADHENFAPDDGARCVNLRLCGSGGELGTSGTDSVANVGRIVVDLKNPESSWTIGGAVSCGELQILSGKLVQKGNLTIFGNALLLGCDIEWEDTVFGGGIYAAEDTIHARSGSTAIFRNGFSADGVDDDGKLKNLSVNNLRREAILLGGDSRFLVDGGANVSLQVVGSRDDGAAAIRVCGALNRCETASKTTSAPIADHGFGNRIDLSRTLEISYFAADGTPCQTPGTAIVGNGSTELILRSACVSGPNSLAGTISCVGQTKVFGNWTLADGFRDCGRVVIGRGGHVDIGDKLLDARSIQFNIDSKRSDAYLHCGGLARHIVFEVIFDGDSLANPNAQSYKLIDGIGDCGATLELMRPLNCGFDFVFESDVLCVALSEDFSVSADSPREIRYKGLLPRDFDDARSPARDVFWPAFMDHIDDNCDCDECDEDVCGEEFDANCAAAPCSVVLAVEVGPQNSCYDVHALAVGALSIETAAKAMAILQDSIECRCGDVKGNGNDPFVSIIGSHGTRKDSAGAKGCSTFYGIIGGADWRWDIGNSGNKYLRGGAFLGYLRGDLSGAAMPSILLKSLWGGNLSVRQNSVCGGLFFAFEQFGNRISKSNLDASICFVRQRNKIVGDLSPYGGRSFSIDLRGTANVFTINNWQSGPWLGIAYGRLMEKGSFFDVSAKISSDIFRTILGLSVEREFSPNLKAPERLLRAFGRVGWCWQGGRNSLNGNIISTDFPPPQSTFDGPFGDRNSAIAVFGFRQKLTGNWELSGSWTGDFSSHYRSCNVSITADYTF